MTIVTLSSAVSLAAAFVVTLWIVHPVHLLPIALVVTAVVPIGRLPLPEVTTVVSPAAIVLLAWVLRRDRDGCGPAPRSVVALGTAILAWLILSTALGISAQRSIGWSTAWALLVLLPTVGRRVRREEARGVTDTWCWTAAALGGFAIVERLIQWNPVYGTVFLQGEYPLVQYWSSYRVTTTLGHPLNNALFFSVGTVLSVGSYVERGRRAFLVAGALGLVGVFLTLSRGGLVAVAVGVAVVTLGPIRSAARRSLAGRSGLRRSAALGVMAIGLGTVAATPAFQNRVQSSNGVASARAREALGSVVWDASRALHHLGAGPGTSNLLLQRSGTPTIVENSWFQLLLSIGAPGVVLVLALVSVVAVLAVRRGALAAGGAVAAIATAAAGFNWIESDRPGLVFLGLLLAAGLAVRTAESRSSPADRGTDGPIQRTSGSLGSAPRGALGVTEPDTRPGLGS